MVDEEVRCSICQAVADPLGDHQVGCGGNGDRIFLHDSLQDALFSAAQSTALAPRREVPSLIPGSKSRPADLYLPHCSRGRPAALDVTVISTMQALTVTGAATTQGHTLSVGENRKMAAHAEACRSVGVTFVPLVVESLGGWSETAVHSIKSIGHQLGQRLGIPPADSTINLFQRLSICLWRGNAAMRIRRCPISSAEVDTVGSPTDRKSLYAHTFLFAAEFRLDAAMVNLIVTNYIFTQLFQKIKTYYARTFFCFI